MIKFFLTLLYVVNLLNYLKLLDQILRKLFHTATLLYRFGSLQDRILQNLV